MLPNSGNVIQRSLKLTMRRSSGHTRMALRYLSREAEGAGLKELAKTLEEAELKCDRGPITCTGTFPNGCGVALLSALSTSKTIEIGTMPLRESCLTSQNETDDCRAGEPRVPGDKLADALQSQIISAFEAAIYQGMRPMDALAIILPGCHQK